MRVVAALLGLALAIGGPAEAQQLEFRNTVRSGEFRLSYRWRDQAGREVATAFNLSRDMVREAEASFADFSLEGMWRAIEAELQDEANRYGRNARITFIRSANTLAWTLETRDNATANELNTRLLERRLTARTAYLARHLRHQVGDFVIVDFAAAARVLKEPMRAVTRALAEDREVANTDRARVARALAFFQAIPYARLDPTQRQGGDFLAAPALLAQNRGDCDSKAAALAAVLQSYVPSRKIAAITMPGHAILAVDLSPEPGERTVRTPGRTLVALEVAGPHLSPIGQVAPLTDRMLAAGRDVEVWPLN
jgi:hypothetical protein